MNDDPIRREAHRGRAREDTTRKRAPRTSLRGRIRTRRSGPRGVGSGRRRRMRRDRPPIAGRRPPPPARASAGPRPRPRRGRGLGDADACRRLEGESGPAVHRCGLVDQRASSVRIRCATTRAPAAGVSGRPITHSNSPARNRKSAVRSVSDERLREGRGESLDRASVRRSLGSRSERSTTRTTTDRGGGSGARA